MSELLDRADELRATAADCKTLLDFSRATGFSMEIARHANLTLSLGLPEVTLPKIGPRIPGKANPKPTKKGGK